MEKLNLVVVGAAGRMGQSLVRAISSSDTVTLKAAVERPGADALGRDAGEISGTGTSGISITDDTKSAFEGADGVLDFTVPQASLAFARQAADMGLFHIIGTTGWEADEDAEIAEISNHMAIVKSGNMSLGVNLLAVLVKQAAKALAASDFDIEVLEMHHRHKVDAPSGTALLLGAAAAEGRNIDLEKSSVRVRDGITGPREEGTIGFATLRGGSVVGEHSVILAGEGELLQLTHRATDRTLFSSGALKAALWARDKKPGLYSMLDVLGLE